MTTYFVNRRSLSTEPYKVVYPEVKTRTSKGYPITFEFIELPEEYNTWEEALEATQRLNASAPYTSRNGGSYPPPPY